MLPRLVVREELPAAGALSSLHYNIGMVAGPATGGLLIASAGVGGAYLVDVAIFAISLLALALMGAVPPPEGAERASLRRVLDGLRYARGRPELLGTYGVDMVAMFFGMTTALFPALAPRYGGLAVLSLLYAAPAVEVLLASVTSGWTGQVHRPGLGVLWAAAGWGLAITLFGLLQSLPAALGCLALAGGADEISGLFRMTIRNQTIPDSLRGRLASIELLSYSSGPTLGNVESGLVAARFGVQVSVLSGGLLCLAGVAVLAALLPAFRAYDRRSRPAELGG